MRMFGIYSQKSDSKRCGFAMISKRKPIRDAKHLKFVGGLPCLVCDSEPTDAHHIRKGSDGGVGLKPSDSFTVPLCRAHHQDIHSKGEQTFFGKRLAAARHLSVALYCANGNTDKAFEAIREYRGE